MSELKFRKPVVWEYNPQRDITAFELAYLIPILFNPVLFENDWQTLPEQVRRHLKRVSPVEEQPAAEQSESGLAQDVAQ